MLENTRDGEQLQIVYLGYCSYAFLCADGIYILETLSLGPEKSWLLDVGTHLPSVPPKISVSFQADRRFFPVAPLRPHCPWFLNPSTHLCFQILQLYRFCTFYIYLITVLFLKIATEWL